MVPKFDRYRRVAQAGKAAYRARPVVGGINGTLLGLQAGRTASVSLGNQGAERILMGLATMRQAPKIYRTQPQGQACAGTEGLPEIVIEVRTAKPLDKTGIFIHREESLSNVFL